MLATYERKGQIRSAGRAFGLVFAVFVALLACWPMVQGGPPNAWLLALAAAFLGLAIWAPSALSLPARLWVKLGAIMHAVASPVVLALVFFLLIAPLGLVRRMLGKASMRAWRNESKLSYWVERDPPGPDPQTLDNQF